MRPILVCLIVLSALMGCQEPAPEISASTVTLMTFNVENLFDTQHDAGKNDYTYLPLETKQSQSHKEGCNRIDNDRWRDQCLYWDWNEAVVTEKLTRIADVIKQIDGVGADIIAFQEIENIGVLERLRTEYLSESGYLPAVLIEGNDLRGIDVAFLSRLPLVGEPKLHVIDFKQISERRQADTRGILEASFALPDGEILTGFAVHFPAPYHPYELRIDAYKTLIKLFRDLPDGRLAFAAGDFNTPSGEDKEQDMLGRFVDPQWHVAHRSCRGCPGSNYYEPQDSWSFLDMILLAKSMADKDTGGWWFDKSSVALANARSFQTTDRGTPARFELSESQGISDHWPLVARIRGPAQ